MPRTSPRLAALALLPVGLLLDRYGPRSVFLVVTAIRGTSAARGRDCLPRFLPWVL